MTVALTDGGEDALLPRFQEGGSPQHLLVTLLGDYWLTRDEHLPSASLVQLMAEFGVSAAGARSAVSRLQRRGVLDSSKVGRRTLYGLNREAARRVLQGARRIMSFGTTEAWDGRWTVIAFSLPEELRDTRYMLRSQLRWLGFAPLYDGVWLSPKADPEVVAQIIDDLEIPSATVFVSASPPQAGSGSRPPIAAWDLGALRATYYRFATDCARLLAVSRDGSISPADALVARTSLMDRYRQFPAMDPELPLELMPEDWPRSVARARFTEAFDVLAPLAEIRVRQIISEFDPELGGLAQCYTSAMLLDGLNGFLDE